MQLELNPINGTAVIRGLTSTSIGAASSSELTTAINSLQTQINTINTKLSVTLYTLTLEPLPPT
jgi:hypothetical protein